MKILVLDDSKTRLSQFKQKLIGHIVDCAETAKEAIELLEKNEYQQAFLDHDLNGKVHQPSGPCTGYEVAKWISEHGDKKPLRIVVHSFNIIGAQNMITLLPEATYIPGVWLLDKMEF
jgi:CheY-like chemotaxis protein